MVVGVRNACLALIGNDFVDSQDTAPLGMASQSTLATDKASVAFEPRRTCARCFRPELVCYCAVCPTISNRTQVQIMQHPRERFHPLGTARIVQQSLHRVELHVLHDMKLAPGVLLPDDALLFPAPGARDLALVPLPERPRRLVVLDGTWHQARQIYKSLPELHALPRFVLSPEQPTRYRIRRPPGPKFVSTLEAVHQALEILEPDTLNLRGLLFAFDRMIDLHLEAARLAPRNPRRRVPKQRPRRHGLPAAILAFTVVYCEAHRSAPSTTPGSKQLLQLCAFRFADGALFHSLVRPREEPAAGQLERIGVHARELEQAPGVEQVLRAFAEFVGGEPSLVTWNQHSEHDLRALLGVPCRVQLKDIYFRLHPRIPGVPASLGSLCRALGYAPRAFALPGRAAARLGEMVALAEGLWEEAFSQGQSTRR